MTLAYQNYEKEIADQICVIKKAANSLYPHIPKELRYNLIVFSMDMYSDDEQRKYPMFCNYRDKHPEQTILIVFIQFVLHHVVNNNKIKTENKKNQ